MVLSTCKVPPNICSRQHFDWFEIYVPGHVEAVSSPNYTFSWASLTKQLKAGVGYIRKNESQFWHFLFSTQAVKISRSS